MSAESPVRTVAVLTEVAAVGRALDYLVPEGFAGPLDPGSRVRVELHGRSVRGWILGEGTEDPGTRPLKALKASLGFGPPPALLELIDWASWRWYGARSRFLAAASPDRIVARLAVRPLPPVPSAPASSLGELGARAAETSEPMLVRLGPATDPLDLVLGMLALLGERRRLEEGSMVIVVPGLGYAARLVGRLARRGIPAVEASEDWAAARAGWPVVVGTRIAAFAPVPALAGIVVLDADDERLSSESAPTWRAGEVAVERARRAGAPCLVVASCPSAADVRLTTPLEIPRAHERAGWPVVAVADRRADDPRTGILSTHLVELARAALVARAEGVAVACVVNRTGRARLLACSRCDALARCTSCDAAMVLETELRCPRCDATRPVICQGCGATKLKLLRLGTAQLAPELSALLGVEVGELTASSGPDALEGVRAVVGTEAVLYRLRRTGLVAFLDLDHHLLAPRVGAEVRTLSLIARAGRLVGGREEHGAGSVLLQTRLVDHPVVLAAQRGDPSEVLAADDALRAALGLPPYRAMARLRGAGAGRFADELAALGLEVAPLATDLIAAVAPTTAVLCDALAAAARPKEQVVVSVDPESI